MTKTAARGPDETPLMRQYREVKERHPGSILLFRMGDFYETFDSDAQLAAEVLGITLTKRANGKASEVALAGFPHHALDTYLPRLVQAGHRVAICEQLEDPKKTRKIVKRGVVEIVTPGVTLHDSLLDPKRPNYLVAVHWNHAQAPNEVVGLAFVDVSTGEFRLAEYPLEELPSAIDSIGPKELLFDRRLKGRLSTLALDDCLSTGLDDWCFGYDFAYETLLRHFGTHSLKGFGVEEYSAGVIAAGAMLHYLSETQRGSLSHIRQILKYESTDRISLDPQTRRNLELTGSMQTGGVEGSLVHVMDQTQTPMGGRLMRNWLHRPLDSADLIEQRLDAVDELFSGRKRRVAVRDLLRTVGDLQRLVTKVCIGRAAPREVDAVRNALEQIPPIQGSLDGSEAAILSHIRTTLDSGESIVSRISAALSDDPPATLADGGVIRPGYSEELDELRSMSTSGKQYLVELQARQAEETGITSLKVGFNRVFGYYLEVTHAHREKVPESWVRKQTLVNAERYITDELKQFEERILGAEERIAELETELFNELRRDVALEADLLQTNARMLSELDVLGSFAEVAERRRYARPTIVESAALAIKDGRHPVVEAMLPAGEPFIPNDVYLDGSDRQILIITGPNMAGKSVVLRQVGLIVLLAQVGSFVPAKTAEIGLVDKIFTRVGASDNLAAGESTFLVEMNETANILNNATPRSLVLLDEVGRGTSTFDGLSIAWAVVEYLHENPAVRARTLFATHYHELNALADKYDRVLNARVQVREHGGKIIFLRKLAPGGADHSYGIEVAKMAGLPEEVVGRARSILQHLETHELQLGDPVVGEHPERTDPSAASSGEPRPRTTRSVSGIDATRSMQLPLFAENPGLREVLDRLRAAEPNTMTPIEALMALADLKRFLDESD